MKTESGRILKRLLIGSALVFVALFFTMHVWVEPVYATDSDGDGMLDAFEMAIGTDPNLADTDGDNLSDFVEVYEKGTDPKNPDTDTDGQTDDVDADPLNDGTHAGGRTTPSSAYTQGCVKPNFAGTMPIDQGSVSVITGEKYTPLASVSVGTGYRGSNGFQLIHYSDITINWRWGYKVLCTWDLRAWEDASGNVVAILPTGQQVTFSLSGGSFTAPAGVNMSCAIDSQADEIQLTYRKGGTVWAFDRTSFWLKYIEDRFGNETTINRNASGVITTVDLAEGNTVTFATHTSGRYSTVTDWGTTARTWTFTYNYYDELAKVTDPENKTTQYYYVNATQTSLDGNVSRCVLPSGAEPWSVEYTTGNQVDKVTIAGNECDYTWATGQTTVNDCAGNQRIWNFTSGNTFPNTLVHYSNRDVRTSDPATWTTTFAHNSNNLRTKIVFAEGNRVDFDWNSNYCLTERRHKATNTDTDSSSDLTWTFTYGSTYFQLEDSTDPEGNTTERTLDSNELVTRIDYETITHPDPDVSIYETFTWNGNGQMLTATDGEGVVTKFEYYSTGAKTGLLWKVTKDYGTGKLNLVTELDYSEYRFLTSTEDPDGYTWTYTTDKLGRRKTATSPSPQGYETNFYYNANGWLYRKDVENVDEDNVRSTTNPWFKTLLDHDAVGRITEVQEEISTTDTRTTEFAFDGNGNITLITLPEENEVQQVFDERNLLAERTTGYGSADAATEKFDYDANGNPTEYENGRGKTTTRTFDDYDRLTKVETPLGHYVEHTLDENGNRTETEWYDASDNLLAATVRSFDELNRLYSKTDWLDADDDGVWDAVVAEQVTTTYDLDNRGLLTVLTNPRGYETEWTYDNARRQTRREDEFGNQLNYSYTNDAFVPTTIEEVESVPTGGTQTFTTEQVTDALHRVKERRIVDREDSLKKHIHKWKRTSQGIPAEYEDAEENKTWLTADGLGRVTKKEVDLGSGNKIVTETTYDENDNVTLYKDDSGNETIYRYTDRDQLKEIEYDDGEKRTFTHNDDGTVSGWTDENGTVVTNTHDDDSRLTARSISRATGVLGPTSESYTYDGLGRMTEAKNTDSTVQMAYDTLSRLTSESQGPNPIGTSGKTFTYTYLKDGSRESLEYPSGYEIDYTVDAVGRWTAVTKDGETSAIFGSTFYGPGFRVDRVTYENGSKEDLGYDGFRFVTSVDHVDSNPTTFASFDYAYDKMGNPLYEERGHQSGGGDIYAYDQAYRLKGAIIGSDDPSSEISDDVWDDGDEDYVDKIDFNMDDVSNRTSVVTTPDGGSASTVSYTSNALNQYTAIGQTNRTHDDNGNLTDDGTYDYSYDYRNNLVRVMDGQTVVMEAEFDALGRRTKKTTDSGNTVVKFFLDGEHVVEEYNGSDTLLRKFVFGQTIDDIRVMIAPDVSDVDDDQDTTELKSFYFHHNMLGSVTHVTDETESVVEQYEYTPYGKTTLKDGSGADLSGQSAIGNPYMFTARRLDEETGLYHYRRRAYDPEAGRFLQRDPLAYTDGPNLYEYTNSLPTALVDPLGEYGYREHHDAILAMAKRIFDDPKEKTDGAAETVAEGSQDGDDDSDTSPGPFTDDNLDFHAIGGTNKEKKAQFKKLFKAALREQDDGKAWYLLGIAMHFRLDMYAHEGSHTLPWAFGHAIGTVFCGKRYDDPKADPARFQAALFDAALFMILFKRLRNGEPADFESAAKAAAEHVRAVWCPYAAKNKSAETDPDKRQDKYDAKDTGKQAKAEKKP